VVKEELNLEVCADKFLRTVIISGKHELSRELRKLFTRNFGIRAGHLGL
jgi:hypothetical protein